MKVLQINSVCGIRSTGRICTDLADVLFAIGQDSLILYGRESAPSQFASFSKKITTDSEVKLHGACARLFDKAGFLSKRATDRFIKEIERYNPDIIHLHNLHGYYLNVETFFEYLKTKDIPVVWTLHDCWAFTGHCSHFSYVDCDGWKNGCGNCPQIKEYPKSFSDNSAANFERKRKCFTGVKNMTLITPSNWLADVVRQSFLGEYPVVVIPNGIDLDSFKPTDIHIREKYGIGDGKIILGVASAWSERKGLYDFVRLSELVSDDYKIVLVGLKDVRGIPEKIITIPHIDGKDELSALYSSAYVFYNPSREETMGLTTVEAMACGAPVAVYDVTAVAETVDKNCGIVIDNCSVEGFVLNLNKFAELDRTQCISRAQNYEKNKMFNKYIEIYEELIK